MTFIDSHAHYEHSRFDSDRDVLLGALPHGDVEIIINVGCDIQSSQESIDLANKYAQVYATAGVHPHEAKTLTDSNLEIIKEMCKHDKVVAFGEIGLDFHYDFSPRDVQRKWFTAQLMAAHEVDMPVAIHSREAGQEVFDTISKSPVRKGVIHCFSGDARLACAYVEMGFYIGIGGVVTYDKTGQLQSVVDSIPLDRILLETDAPYLTPAPYRGKRNESQYLSYVVDAIAKIKNISADDVCNQTTQNVRKLFPRIR